MNKENNSIYAKAGLLFTCLFVILKIFMIVNIPWLAIPIPMFFGFLVYGVTLIPTKLIPTLKENFLAKKKKTKSTIQEKTEE